MGHDQQDCAQIKKPRYLLFQVRLMNQLTLGRPKMGNLFCL